MQITSANKFGTVLTMIVVFLSLGTFLYIVSSENLFQRFMPRSVCMFGESKLILTHAISDAMTFVSYLFISGALYGIYKSFKNRNIPFKGFFWMYAGFIFLCGLTHLIGVINLFVTFYWFDGIIKMATGWFSLAVAISFLGAYKSIKEFKTPAEWDQLSRELEDLKMKLKIKE